jgi:homoserine kinase
MAMWAIRVPASSANLGAGFDVLGMALSIHADVGLGEPPSGAHAVDDRHPATIAFRRLDGDGPLWVRSSIPMGRGLGYSGAVRVGGAAAAIVQRDGVDAIRSHAARSAVLRIGGELEGHLDNIAPSLFGGVVAVAGDRVQPVPVALDPAIVVWISNVATTSTDRSRAALPEVVTREDAVFNLGRVATFVAACASGDRAALRTAVEDRLHQPQRLAEVPDSAAAIESAFEAGAWAAWLSGSGPTVAAMCDTRHAEEIAAALPETGHTKLLRIDHAGAVVVNA